MIINIGEGTGYSAIVWGDDEEKDDTKLGVVTCAGIKIRNFKLRLQQLDGREEARTLDAVLVQIIRVSAG